jgi:membrane-bound lytic murein transglycosylase D
VTLARDMDVALIASLAGISERDFRTLNPSIKQPVVMAAGTPNILLPWDNAKVFEERLKTHHGALASWTAWVAPTTMSVAQVASQVGMSESELRQVNNIPPRMKVRAGSSLLVHRSGPRDRDVSEFVADHAQLSLTPDIVLKRSVVRARKGDSLSTLAQRYGVSAVSVAGWNRLPVNARLKKGQPLTLMLPRSVRMADTAQPRTSVRAERAERTRKVTRDDAKRSNKRQAKGNKVAQRGKPAGKAGAKSKRTEVKVATSNGKATKRKNRDN